MVQGVFLDQGGDEVLGVLGVRGFRMRSEIWHWDVESLASRSSQVPRVKVCTVLRHQFYPALKARPF